MNKVLEYTLMAIQLVHNVATTVDQARDLWKGYAGKIETMKSEDRDPTQEEWDELYGRVKDSSAKLQSL